MTHPNPQTTRRAGLAALAASLLLPTIAWAQTAPATATAATFPNKPIRIILPFTAGGTTDVLARSIGQKLSESWGQPVVVENRPGASGWNGMVAMARMPADGHVFAVTISNIIYAKSLYADLPFNVEKDFAPVSMISRSPVALVVLSSFPASNLREFVEQVRAHPGKHSYASFGQGTTAHIFGETLKLDARLDMVHVPYKGAAPAVNDLLGGQVSSAYLDTGTVLPLLQAGKVKVLAISGTQRLGAAPSVPTFLEQGYKGFEPVGFFQALAPAGVPADVLHKLSDGIAKAVQSPDLKARIVEMGQDPAGSTPEVLAAAIRSDAALFDRTIKTSNIKVEQN
ncbi:tripartite tricarboxylate transporter substrate binding protein [Variovorax rhizosphaerae]|uniref:Tripartite tricarboxylate transporter substrate binding protein n=1 Tax=Variovorax rhizosphaerae TaxID=1836200 RepID=A0ABU8WE96_9BURK